MSVMLVIVIFDTSYDAVIQWSIPSLDEILRIVVTLIHLLYLNRYNS